MRTRTTHLNVPCWALMVIESRRFTSSNINKNANKCQQKQTQEHYLHLNAVAIVKAEFDLI